MFTEFIALVPKEGLQIPLVLFLSFLIGLEREESRTVSNKYFFGGVRTFPLIGLVGYAAALLSGTESLLFSAGLLAVGGLMMIAYRHKISLIPDAGVTSEVSGLMAFVLGALVFREMYWIASTLVICCLIVLELKSWLENLSKKIPVEEIHTFTKFLLLTIVILPVFPDKAFGPFEINPFKTWVIVVATSGISYASYIIQKALKGRGGLLLAAILGGAYSSTVTTVVLSREAAKESRPHLYSGGILAASGTMYIKIAIFLLIFNLELFHRLGPSFLALALVALIGGALWSRRADPEPKAVQPDREPKNPLELHTAFVFALFFVAMLVLSNFVIAHLGRGGVYGLAALMGLSNNDPFILSMTQSRSVALEVASVSIVITAVSNNILKGVYASVLAKRETGRQSLILLLTFALLGLLPLLGTL